MDATGLIGAAPMERTLAACGRYAQLCREAGAEAVRFVATSASRDARNAADFVAGVERAFADFGVTPEVVSGDVEAQLSFSGATGDLIAAEIPAPYLVVDLGAPDGDALVRIEGVETPVGPVSSLLYVAVIPGIGVMWSLPSRRGRS